MYPYEMDWSSRRRPPTARAARLALPPSVAPLVRAAASRCRLASSWAPAPAHRLLAPSRAVPPLAAAWPCAPESPARRAARAPELPLSRPAPGPAHRAAAPARSTPPGRPDQPHGPIQSEG
uniref:Uncharacterized protein n=1 Tax=Setaria viridis TaxID=4556 RepID=A0A4U6TJ95_SETVI|nr:hypothetical protein SEVIR_8G247800v2 [Setaria viridis]